MKVAEGVATMEKKALGRGLKALIPEVESGGTDRILYIKVDEIRPNKYQPRGEFDAKGIEELAASIKEKGLIQPVIVRRSDRGYELIAGERRLRAVLSLGIEKIPAIIRETESAEAFILSLIENLHRENLNPIEEARAFSRLIEEFEFTQDTIAQSVRKDRASVANILRLLKLPQEIQKALSFGKISIGHAKVILSEEDEAKQLELFKRILAGRFSVREAERFTKRRAKGRKRIAPDPHLVAVEEELQHILGTRVRIVHHKKKGIIQIEYYSNEDLDRISTILRGARKRE